VAEHRDARTVPPLDLSASRRLHIVGVGGVGMSALALLLARMGHDVTGSDTHEPVMRRRLEDAGVRVLAGNRPENVPANADAVVYSTAVPDSNVELVTARERGLPVVHRAQALAGIAATRRTVAVAGSHGKTTTSSMLTLILRAAGWDPSFLVGGEVQQVGSNAGFGAGEWLVVEADESDGTFLHFVPDAALVTNIEPDHLEYYGDFERLVAAFDAFVACVSGPVVGCIDDAEVRRLALRHPSVRTYGTAKDAFYRIVDEIDAPDSCRFTLTAGETPLGQLVVPLGVKAASNAAGATALALELGVEFGAAARALRDFAGVARRFERRGERNGVTFVDDYAHLPSEVAAAIATARLGPWQRVIAVFQPHRYTRTGTLWRDFADAFTAADTVVLTDVYPAGEHPVEGVSGRLILQAVLGSHPDLPVAYLPRREDLVDVPRRYARPGDVVLTLGAGDLTTLPDVWLAK
jgi:UDP-N-acetylmuramate--alanine ligase